MANQTRRKRQTKKISKKPARTWQAGSVQVVKACKGVLKFDCGDVRPIDFRSDGNMLVADVYYPRSDGTMNIEYGDVEFGTHAEVLALAEFIANLNGKTLVDKPAK